jgi:hypothetical protein
MPDRNLVTDLTALASSPVRDQMLEDAECGAYSPCSRPTIRLAADFRILRQEALAKQAELGDYRAGQQAVQDARGGVDK